jgi:hypothetical protein
MSKYDKELDTRTAEYDEAAKPLQGEDDAAPDDRDDEDDSRDE